MGGWAVAQSPILVTTVTLERLRKRGYEAMLACYEKIAPSRFTGTPLYTRPAWPVLTEEGSSGVRGAPVGLTAHRPSTRLWLVLFYIHISFHSDVESFRMVSISREHTINPRSIVSSEVQATLFIVDRFISLFGYL